MSSTEDCLKNGLATESSSSALDNVSWSKENDCLSSQKQLIVQLATKQRIIDDVLQSLQRCMRGNSELEIQKEVLRKQLDNEKIETQKLKLSSDWYRSELHTVQRALRGQKDQDVGLERLREANRQLKVDLKKALSECAILTEKLNLERNRKCIHDSGIFTESSADSSSELDIMDVSSTTTESHSKIAHWEKTIFELQQKMDLEKEVWCAEREMLLQQVQLKTNLLTVQQNSVDQMRIEVGKANETAAAKQREYDSTVSDLASCRQRMVKLGQENDVINRESLKMILKFEEMSYLIAEYRQEIWEKDKQLRMLAASYPSRKTMIDRCSQTLAKPRTETCDKSAQVTANFSLGNYYKNLLTVIEREHRMKLGQREVNIRTLIRQVREQMRMAQEAELRYKELGDVTKLFMQQVLPKTSVALHGELVETVRRATVNLFNPPETSLSTKMECKLCDSLKASLEETNKIIVDLEVKHRQELQTISQENYEHVAQVSTLKGALVGRQAEAENSAKLINILELERVSLNSSLVIIKGKMAMLEKQMLDQGQVKCAVESERLRYHQLMVLLIQIKNTRDELLCQNETLNKLLRGLSVVANEPNSKSIAAKANETLKRCAKYKKSSAGLRPLCEGVSGLRQEIAAFKSAILWKTCGEVSLLDELQAMENDQRLFL